MLQPSGPGWQQGQKAQLGDWGSDARSQGPWESRSWGNPQITDGSQHVDGAPATSAPLAFFPTHGARAGLGVAACASPPDKGTPEPEGPHLPAAAAAAAAGGVAGAAGPPGQGAAGTQVQPGCRLPGRLLGWGDRELAGLPDTPAWPSPPTLPLTQAKGVGGRRGV